MNKICFIYPEDTTTMFLEEIVSYLKKECGDELIDVLRIEGNRDSHQKCIEELKEYSNNMLFVFLGHGTSTSLGGANIDGYSHGEFVSEEAMSIFKDKELLLVSCHSEQLIDNYAVEAGIKSAIGFGELPTDESDIDVLKHMSSVYENLNMDVIEMFRNEINSVIKGSLYDYMFRDLSINELYLHIKLRINKRMSEILLEDNNNNTKILTGVLYEMKKELLMYRN